MHHDYKVEEVNRIIEWIKGGLRLLVTNDRDLLIPDIVDTEFALEGKRILDRKIHETTINHWFSVYLEQLVEDFGIIDYNIDLEYNRFGNNKKFVEIEISDEAKVVRPDILVHKRLRLDEVKPHFLVIEAKKEALIKKDIKHVKGFMSDASYKYKYGCLISYYELDANIKVNLLTLEDGQYIDHEFQVEI